MGAITPITPNNYLTIPKGMVFARFPGNEDFEELGDLNSCSVKWENEKMERYDNRRGKRVKTYEGTVQTTGTFETELVFLTDRVLALASGSDVTYMTQAAETDLVFPIAKVKVGGKYKLPHEHVENCVLSDKSGTPVAYVEGTHYVIDEDTGFFEIKAVPAGVTENAELVYDKKVVTAADKKLLLNYASNLDIEAEIIIDGTADVGRNTMDRFWKVSLKSDSGRTFVQDGQEFVSVTVTGSILADTSKPEIEQYGYSMGK